MVEEPQISSTKETKIIQPKLPKGWPGLLGFSMFLFWIFSGLIAPRWFLGEIAIAIGILAMLFLLIIPIPLEVSEGRKVSRAWMVYFSIVNFVLKRIEGFWIFSLPLVLKPIGWIFSHNIFKETIIQPRLSMEETIIQPRLSMGGICFSVLILIIGFIGLFLYSDKKPNEIASAILSGTILLFVFSIPLFQDAGDKVSRAHMVYFHIINFIYRTIFVLGCVALIIAGIVWLSDIHISPSSTILITIVIAAILAANRKRM